MEKQTNARSFEQDLLWSICDQDAAPDILRMANDRWRVDAATAWSTLQHEARLGRLWAYSGEVQLTPVDLTTASLVAVVDDYALHVEPTSATQSRLANCDHD